MRKHFGFRAWFYFRQGWGTYFAFILAAINTMVVTYYLAIDNLPFLKQVFPSFAIYSITAAAIGIPLFIAAGYIHYKRSHAISEEVEVTTEANPYLYKIPPGWNAEVVFPLYLILSDVLVKISRNEKLTNDDLEKISELQKKISLLLKGGYVGNFWQKVKLENDEQKK